MHSTDASRSSPAPGRGLGREHALLFASEGAKVVVNDLGGDMHGEGGDPSAAHADRRGHQGDGRRGRRQRRERRRLGRRAAARAARRSTTFGDLHVLVNNAGILRDRVIINMTEAEWDAVDQRAPEGPLLPDAPRGRVLARADEGGQGRERRRSSTRRRRRACSRTPARRTTTRRRAASRRSRRCARRSSSRYGVRSNAIAPGARTRLTEATPGLGGRGEGARGRLRRVGPGQRVAVRRVPRDRRLPVHRREVHGAGREGAARAVVEGRGEIDKGDRWTVAELAAEAAKLAPPPKQP